MDGSEGPGSRLVYTVEPAVGEGIATAGVLSPDWRGRISDLGNETLKLLWAEAVAYARWEIGRYRIWRGLDEPVLASGYDAEGAVQAAFERLLYREAGGVPIFYSAEQIGLELRRLIKHRVRWLHERKETGLVVSESDVMPPRPDEGLVSVFDYLPGGLPSPEEELMRKEKEQRLDEFKAGFQTTLVARRELLGVFCRMWEGRKQREIARGLGVGVEQIKALQAQVRRKPSESAAHRILEC